MKIVALIVEDYPEKVCRSIRCMKCSRWLQDAEIILVDNCCTSPEVLKILKDAHAWATVVRPLHQLPDRYLGLFAISTIFGKFKSTARCAYILETGVEIIDKQFEMMKNALDEVDDLAIAFLTPRSPKAIAVTRKCFVALSNLRYFESQPLPRDNHWETLARSMQNVGLQVVTVT